MPFAPKPQPVMPRLYPARSSSSRRAIADIEDVADLPVEVLIADFVRGLDQADETVRLTPQRGPTTIAHVRPDSLDALLQGLATGIGSLSVGSKALSLVVSFAQRLDQTRENFRPRMRR
jgi:hypothetical protein